MSNKNLKIVFFGTPDFAVESLNAIVDAGFDVAAVVTATDKVAGRGHRLLCSAVKEYALNKGIPVLQPAKLKDTDFITALREINADLFVVIAFRMLPEVVWSMPRLGTFNLHASLLPKYRGAAPINRAVMAGETETGVTTFFLQQEIDTGDIIDRVAIDILPEDNAGSVHDKLMKLGAKLTVKTIRAITDGNLVTTPQEELARKGIETTLAPKIFKETCRVDWNRPAVQLHNHIRGLSPYPGAWTVIKSESTAPTELKLFKSEVTDIVVNNAPGTVVIKDGDMWVNCNDFMLRLIEIQPAGKKRMGADAYLRGARLVNPFME